MKKIPALLTLILVLALGPTSASAIPQPSPIDLDPDFLAEIHRLFPESQEVAPRLLDYRVDPNLHLFQEAEIEPGWVWLGNVLIGIAIFRTWKPLLQTRA